MAMDATDRGKIAFVSALTLCVDSEIADRA